MIDVCLVLEGTYPYVAGGVSTWVHQLITSMKDLRFGIVYIAPHSDPTRKLKYKVPNHVLYLKEIYLHDYDFSHQARRRPSKKDYEIIKEVYEEFAKERYEGFEKLVTRFQGEKSCFDAKDFFSSKEVWDLLLYFYEKRGEDISFLDYFWTWRGIYLPLIQVVQSEIPFAKIYHAVSTGYAGMVGAIAKIMHRGKYFLTEHGIYTHERMLEIAQAGWIFEKEMRRYRAERELSFFKQWWVSTFQAMSRIAYVHADRIFTLFEGNKMREVLDGADSKKISIIPNGIEIQKFADFKRERKPVPQIALIGRVVSIKDIKTFIQSAKLVLTQFPDAQFYILGPYIEEEDYYEECKSLVEALHLEQNITFTGSVHVPDYLKFLDLVVLTSISEAQPYVILEAGVVEIPMVATDVGACREMLEGRSYEDQLLGRSGLITEVANPNATAEAIVRLLRDKEFYEQCSRTAIERAKRYYDLDDLLSRYLNIYEQNL